MFNFEVLTLFIILILKDIELGIIEKGHKKKCFNFGGSVVQGIQIINRNLSNKYINAYSDPRKGKFKIKSFTIIKFMYKAEDLMDYE